MTTTSERPASAGRSGLAADRARARVPAAGLTAGAVLAVVISTWLTLPAAVPGLLMPGPIVEYGLPVARLVLDLAATATIGLSLLPKLLGFDNPDRTEPIAARARHWAVLFSLIWCAAALLSAVLSAAEVTPGGLPDVAAYVDGIGAGQGMIVSASCALASAAVGMLAVRFGEKVPAELRVLVAGFGLLPLPVTGHASNWYWHDLSMVAMELHVIGACAWVGGLVALAVLLPRHRDLLAVALPRFSRLATYALIVVGLSGTFNGLVELLLSPTESFPASLFTTGYGLLVVAKAVLTAVIALLGGNIRWRLLPAVTRQVPTAFAAWAALELTVMGLTYGVAVALTKVPVA
ncbi:copper resistance protein CopD [Microbispora rosea subsp. aerata]|nr:CopD family protein [Microbispora rosea]GGO27020.1 copper resistance protein CopD [Microbispora rosea subsp. aerata]GIH58520.1 copper resistance protein CopD [Microbispora rosea subsp. aerata]GLJ86147.1 copper resistance protein CopD [Microbispora rosea subsp. aerata]